MKISDYNCNLFSIIDVKKLPEYKTDLKELFTLPKARNNSDDLHSLVTNNEAYQNIDSNTAIMMREFADIKLPRKNKEGKYNMCKAILDLEKKNQLIGADKAWIEAITNLMTNTKKSFEESCSSLGISKTDMDRYKKMI